MKLKTTAILALGGILLSAAGAFAIPVAPGARPDPAVTTAQKSGEGTTWQNRISVGDTLQVDARLGHSSLPKTSRGETYLFAQVSAADANGATSLGTTPLNLAVV